MTTVEVAGKQYPCLEHMNEIKNTANGELFNKYYNKKQMFKDLLYKVKRRYCGKNAKIEEFEIDPAKGFNSEYDNYGLMVGQVVYSGSYCYTIEIYKLEDLLCPMTSEFFYEESEFDHEQLAELLDWESSFFVKDDNGQVYFIYTNVD